MFFCHEVGQTRYNNSNKNSIVANTSERMGVAYKKPRDARHGPISSLSCRVWSVPAFISAHSTVMFPPSDTVPPPHKALMYSHSSRRRLVSLEEAKGSPLCSSTSRWVKTSRGFSSAVLGVGQGSPEPLPVSTCGEFATEEQHETALPTECLQQSSRGSCTHASKIQEMVDIGFEGVEHTDH